MTSGTAAAASVVRPVPPAVAVVPLLGTVPRVVAGAAAGVAAAAGQFVVRLLFVIFGLFAPFYVQFFAS